MKAASIAGIVVAVAALGAMWYEGCLIASGVVGIAVQIGAVCLMIWARITFGKRSFHAVANPTEGGLVTTGPFAYLRHPIYAAAMYVTWAGALTNFSMISVSLAAIATAGLGIRMIAEESLVVVRYPEYADYAKRTRRVIPYVL